MDDAKDHDPLNEANRQRDKAEESREVATAHVTKSQQNKLDKSRGARFASAIASSDYLTIGRMLRGADLEK